MRYNENKDKNVDQETFEFHKKLIEEFNNKMKLKGGNQTIPIPISDLENNQ